MQCINHSCISDGSGAQKSLRFCCMKNGFGLGTNSLLGSVVFFFFFIVSAASLDKVSLIRWFLFVLLTSFLSELALHLQ